MEQLKTSIYATCITLASPVFFQTDFVSQSLTHHGLMERCNFNFLAVEETTLMLWVSC